MLAARGRHQDAGHRRGADPAADIGEREHHRDHPVRQTGREEQEQQDVARGGERQRPGERGPVADPRRDPGVEHVAHRDDEDGRQHLEPRRHRARAARGLEEEAEDEQRPVEGEVEEEADHIGRGEAAVREERDRQDGGAGGPLTEQESGERERGDHEGPQDERCGPALVGPFDERVAQRPEGEQAQDVAAAAERRAPGRDGRHEPPGEQQSRDADGQVDEEDAAPAEGADQEAADGRRQADGGGDDRGPDAEDLRPAGRFGEGVHQQRQRAGHEERRTHALDEAGGHQDDAVRRDGAQQGRAGEHGEPDEIDPAGAEPFRQRPGEQQQRGEGEDIAVDDPGEAGHAQSEPGPQVGGGDIHDAGVEARHHEPERQDEELDAAAGVRPGAAAAVNGLVRARRHARRRFLSDHEFS